MRWLGLAARLIGTFLWAAAVAFVGWYLVLSEGWTADLTAFQGRK